MHTQTQTPTLWQMILLVLPVYVLGALFAQTC